MFDFLKDAKHTENKYKSTSLIPCFTGEELMGNSKGDSSSGEDKNMDCRKEEVFTPFFSIEEDLEMEDAVSCSDGRASETEDTHFYSFATEFKARPPKRIHSSKQTTPIFSLLAKRAN
mmetsp:Transcript_13250/g.15366  ORF Transcript_13250/g.15366 Transcript_13250/m.15366 type:complete len:118 (-) Transcript_13250:96-449(-)